MANNSAKEIRVAWEKLCKGFEDLNVLSMAVTLGENRSPESQERTNDTIWKPIPYIMNSFDGRDQTGNFQDSNGLTVPCRVNTRKSIPWTFNDNDLRDPLQMQRVIQGASRKIASDINKKVNDVVFNQGTIVVSQSGAATGYEDLALCDTQMNIRGVDTFQRHAALNSADYNSMAGNLAERQYVGDIVSRAYQQAYIDRIATFDTLKLDYGNTIAAATATGVTVDGAGQYYTPAPTATFAGEEINKDNRYQDLTVAVTGGAIAEGDAFTIAGVNSLHQEAKTDTGELQTFRVIAVNSPTSITISPAIVSNGGATTIEQQYQNCTATPADTAAITFLNTTTRQGNVFWQQESIELTPGIVKPEESGVEIMEYTSPQGIQLVMQKQGDINTSTGKYRLDAYFGVTNKNPEMNGLLLFNQA